MGLDALSLVHAMRQIHYYVQMLMDLAHVRMVGVGPRVVLT